MLELEGSKPNQEITDKTVCSFLKESIKLESDVKLVDSKLETGRKSMMETQKENHPLTPKNRVSINLSNFVTN